MRSEILQQNIELVARQRNLFLVLSMVSIFSLTLLVVYLVNKQQKIILVPGLQQEAWVSEQGVSVSYLEQVAVMYLPLLLDLDVHSINWKRDRVLENIAASDQVALQKLSDYFARVKERYQQFSLSTHFALKKLESQASKLIVRADGQLISRFGNRGYESEAVSYLLKFKWLNGRLLLEEFYRIKSEE